MILVWGLRSYVLKNFKPEDLGLFTNEYDKYTFQIVQNYFHLFWIPLLPTGTTYLFTKAGSSDTFHAPDSFKQLMMQHRIPWWHRLGALAIPIIGLLIFVFSSLSERAEHAKYAAQMVEEKKEVAALTADTAALREYPQKINTIYNLVRKNFEDKKEKFAKIDTSLSKVLGLMLGARFSIADTTTNFSDDNTIIYHNDYDKYIFDDKNELDEKNLDEIWNVSGLDRVNSNIIDWYKSGMKDEVKDFNASSLKHANEIIDDKKYLAVMRITGFATPIVFSEEVKQKMRKENEDYKKASDVPTYEGGYASANVYVYDLEKNSFKYQFKVFAHNSETIQTYHSRYESNNDKLLINLHQDLMQNLNKEVEYALRIREREVKEDELSSVTD
jgi:predicted transposase YbfD/YdcC